MKTTRKSAIGLKGQIKVEVLDHTGNVIEERPWQDNLILDQGLNNMADKYVAQLFEWAAAGTGGELLDPHASSEGGDANQQRLHPDGRRKRRKSGANHSDRRQTIRR
jgi:hypothetical protein